MIPRVHLFEFEDLKSCPKILRECLTDFLEYCAVKFKLYEDLSPILHRALKKTRHNNIIDLGSGGGGGMDSLYQSLKCEIPDLKIKLTDLYPNLTAFDKLENLSGGSITHEKTPIDATNLPTKLTGFRTCFRCFHHFPPKIAKSILQNAIDHRQPIGIFEAQERSILFAMYFLLINPILILIVTPFINPFSWKRLLFTYFIPVMPFIIAWDSAISCLRTYEPKDLKSIIESLENQANFHWETNKIRKGPKVVIYLIGHPLN